MQSPRNISIQNLRSDEFYIVAKNLNLEDLLRLCSTSRQTDIFCREPRFIALINEKARDFDQSLARKQDKPLIPFMMITDTKDAAENTTITETHTIPGHEFEFIYNRMAYSPEYDPKNWYNSVAPGTDKIKNYSLWKQEYDTLRGKRRRGTVNTVQYAYWELVKMREILTEESDDEDADLEKSLLYQLSKDMDTLFRQEYSGSYFVETNNKPENVKRVQDFIRSIGAFATEKEYEIYKRQKQDRIDYLLSNVLHGGYPYTLDILGSDGSVYRKLEFYTRGNRFHIRETVLQGDSVLSQIASNVTKISDDVYEASWNLDFRTASNDELVQIEDIVADYDDDPQPLGAYGTMLKLLEDYF